MIKVTTNDIWYWVGETNMQAADSLKIALSDLLNGDKTIDELREEILAESKAYTDKQLGK